MDVQWIKLKVNIYIQAVASTKTERGNTCLAFKIEGF